MAQEGIEDGASEEVQQSDAAPLPTWDSNFGGHWPLDDREIVAINALIQMHRGYLARSKRVWLAGLVLAIVAAAAVAAFIAWDMSEWLGATGWPVLIERAEDGSWVVPGP